MSSPLSFYTLRSYVDSLKGDLKQSDLARRLGSTQPRIHQIFKDKLHWIYPEVRQWTRLLKLRRMEGDYFELLTLTAAFPFQSDKSKIITRAFTLLGNLEEKLDSSDPKAHAVLFWLDPVVRLLCALIDMDGFPARGEDVPDWILSRVHFVAAMGSHEKAKQERITASWNWLVRQGILVFDESSACWKQNTEHPFLSLTMPSELEATRREMCRLCHVNSFLDFSREAGSGELICFDIGTVCLSSEFLPLVQNVCKSFVTEEIAKIQEVIRNPESLEDLRKSNPRLAKEIAAFLQTLTQANRASRRTPFPLDTTVEILLSSRALARSVETKS